MLNKTTSTMKSLRQRGLQSGVDLKPPQAAVVKSHGGERCGKAGTRIPAGAIERGERKTASGRGVRGTSQSDFKS
jgi:hypothetical protein